MKLLSIVFNLASLTLLILILIHVKSQQDYGIVMIRLGALNERIDMMDTRLARVDDKTGKTLIEIYKIESK